MQATTYHVYCIYCFGCYDKKQLWRHCKSRCVWRQNDEQEEEKNVVNKGCMLLPVPDHVSGQTQEILSRMRRDEVYRAALNDPVIMQFARRLTGKHYADPDRHEHVRCKIREVGRLLLQLKKDHRIPSMADALDPLQYQKVVSSVRQVSGFDHQTNSFSTPSLALKLGHSLKKCAMLLVSEALQTGSKYKEEKANAFIRLCDMEWSNEVSTTALSTLRTQKLNKVTIVPLTEDITKMHSFLKKSKAHAQAALQSDTVGAEERAKSWLSLAQLMLAQLILFNRRRVGR